MMHHILEQVPDSAKITSVAITPILSIFGVPLEQWVYVLSAIMTILFIIEKIPKVIISLKWMWERMRCREPRK